MRYVGLAALALLRLVSAERFLATVSWGRRLAEGELQVIRGGVLKTRYGYDSI